MSNNVGVYVDKFDNCYIYDGEDLCEKDVTKKLLSNIEVMDSIPQCPNLSP